jgi:multidrug efflux pump subunit AcrA (membrane-fusion protein)
MQLFKGQAKPGLYLRLATATAGLLMLAACATVPQPPMAELQAAELAIADAERARVADYASAELSEARAKLRAAQSAVQKENMVQAMRLAEQSRVDAELASARAEAARAKVVNDEMLKSIDAMKQEMQRNTGEQQ